MKRVLDFFKEIETNGENFFFIAAGIDNSFLFGLQRDV